MSKPAGGNGGQRGGDRQVSLALSGRLCPYSRDCHLEPLHDGSGTVQAVVCRLCHSAYLRSDLHTDLFGSPGIGL